MKRFISALSSLCLAATSLLGSAASIPASAAGVKASGAAVTYDIVPEGKDYTKASGSGNNIYTATAGETLTLDWMVTNDPGTAGMQFVIDFGGLEYVSRADGDSYMADPEIQDAFANKSADQIANADDKILAGCVTYAWGQSVAEDPVDSGVVYKFTVKVPAGASDTKYVVGPKSGTTQKAIPVDQDDPHTITFHGLEIQVGEPTQQETTAPTAQTTQPQQQTQPQEEETKPAETIVVDDKTIIYNFVPDGKDCTVLPDASVGNNVYNVAKADCGKEITIDWKVKNDPGTAGIQLAFDFGQVEYVSAEDGDCYMWSPEFNDKTANTTGEIIYTVGQATAEDPVDDGVVYKFTVKIPEAGASKKTYSIGLMDSSKASIGNKVIPVDQDNPFKFNFHGLDIVVPAADGAEETDPPVSADAIIYDLVKKGDKASVTGTDSGNNKATVEAGETVDIEWRVKNDPGTAGIQMAIDFSQIEYVGKADGDAYMADPTFQDEFANKTADQIANAEDKVIAGCVVYAWGQSTAEDPVSDGVVYRFTVKIPADAKTGDSYVIAESKAQKNKVIPVDQDHPYTYVFHGLELTVADSTETTAPTVETTAPTVETTAPSDEPDVPAGSVNWAIGKVDAAAGAKVSVPVKVSADAGTAGFVAEFSYDSSLAYTGLEAGGAYTGTAKATVINSDKLVIVWASDDGKDQQAADGAVVLNLNFTAPTAGGTYPVTFKSLEVVNTSGNALTVTKEDGYVHVDEELNPAGKANWTIGEEVVAAGAAAKVPVTVSGDEGTAGYIVQFDYDKALTFTGIDLGTAYTGAAKATVINDNQLLVVWASDDGSDQKAADDAVVVYLNFTAPEAGGTYPVTFKSSVEAVNTDGQQLTVTQKDGAVIVAGEEDEVPGKSNWVISEETVGKGEKAAVKVTVNGDEGTAGYVVKFNYDTALVFDGIEAGGAYTGGAKATVINENQLLVVFASDDGKDQKAADDAVVLTLNFTAPDAEGRYPVTFESLEVVNTAGLPLTLTQKDGAVIVEDNPEDETTAPEDETTAPEDETTAPEDETTAPTNETTAPITPDETTAPEQGDAGSATWIIGEKTVGKGAAAQVPVTVQKAAGTAGFVVQFDYDSNLTFNGIELGTAYTGTAKAAVINDKELIVVWASDDGDNQNASDDAVVVYLNFTAPDEAGRYPVTFKSLEVVNEDGSALDLTKQDGAVIVEDVPEDETTAPNEESTKPADETTAPSDETTAPSEETTAPAEDQGQAVYQIAEVEGAAGTTVEVPVYVWFDQGTAGLRMQFAVEDGFKITGWTIGNAYTNKDDKEFAAFGDEAALVWTSEDGKNQKATPGAKIVTLQVAVPDDAKPGTYPVVFVDGSIQVSDEESKELQHTEINGSITIKEIPVEETTAPVDETTAPSDETTDPSAETTAPSDETTVPSDETTAPSDETTAPSDETTAPGETTTTTAPEEPEKTETSVVTAISIDYTPPTRVNYWSHDERPFKDTAEIGGFDNLTCKLTLSKYYINADGQFVDQDGKVLSKTKYDAAKAIPEGVEAFETKELDATPYTHAMDDAHQTDALKAEDSPAKVWNNEIAEALGKTEFDDSEVLAAYQEGKITHKNKYTVPVYFFSDEQDDPDFQLDEPLALGDFAIYIGVKGDTDLDNIVNVTDAQITLTYYVNYVVTEKSNPYVLNDDEYGDVAWQDNGKTDGLRHFVSNVAYLDDEGNRTTGFDALDVTDAQLILTYYVNKYVVDKSDTSWTGVVGYDFLDEFHKDQG